jgi:hypothetical protein
VNVANQNTFLSTYPTLRTVQAKLKLGSVVTVTVSTLPDPPMKRNQSRQFECMAVINPVRVEHRTALDLRLGFARTIPGHVHAVCFAQRELCTADFMVNISLGSYGHRCLADDHLASFILPLLFP